MFSPTKFVKNRDEVLKAEEIAAQLLGAEVNPTPKDNRYLDQLRAADLLKDGQPYAEVKVDWRSAVTDNVVVETGSLFKSSAPYVVYVLPCFFMAPRVELLSETNLWPQTKGGDWNEELRLIKRTDFIKLPFVKRIG